MLQSTGSQRVGHNWATELNWIFLYSLSESKVFHVSSYFPWKLRFQKLSLEKPLFIITNLKYFLIYTQTLLFINYLYLFAFLVYGIYFNLYFILLFKLYYFTFKLNFIFIFDFLYYLLHWQPEHLGNALTDFLSNIF